MAFPGFVPGSAAVPQSEIELTISCRNLVGKDVLSKSDPMCAVFMKPFGENRWIEVKRTEIVKNNHNPDFSAKVNVMYRFEELQHLKFVVVDIDSTSSRLEDHDMLGFAETTVGNIVSSGSFKQNLRLGAGDGLITKAAIIVKAEELSNCRDDAEIQFVGKNLEKQDFFGKSDPFLLIHKSNEDNTWTLVHKTEVIKCNLNPQWRPITIPVRSLCNGDYDRNIKVECYDHNNSGDHGFIGEFFVTLNQLSKSVGTSSNTFDCINPEKQKKKKSYKNSGVIHVVNFNIRKRHTFLDYVRGGTELNCTISIDFTGSNGNPTDPRSLHFLTQTQPNSYESVLSAVGDIIRDYDSDKMFPVLGFGAKIPPTGAVSHVFFVNFHPNNPHCADIPGVLMAYRNCLSQIQLYGPTNFSPTINHVGQIASQFQDGSKYFILLIITDGIITDMEQTKKAIVHASSLPLSIIIVGVGEADFSAMEELDADTVALESGGVRAVRDIVQFVPFSRICSQFLRHHTDPSIAKLYLAKEVLAEIPNQFLSFMKSKNIVPQPPRMDIDLSALSVTADGEQC